MRFYITVHRLNIHYSPLPKSLCKHTLLSAGCGCSHQCWRWQLCRELGSIPGKAALRWWSGAVLLVLFLPRQRFSDSGGVMHLLATTASQLHEGPSQPHRRRWKKRSSRSQAASFLSPELLQEQTRVIRSPSPSSSVFPVPLYSGYLRVYLLFGNWKRHPMPDCKHPELTR